MQHGSIRSLDGLWKFAVPGGKPELRQVPGSYDCVGDSVWSREFPADPNAAGRVRLCFEGIAYEGKAYLNGVCLGTMLPYSYYTFEVTQLLRAENELTVELMDLNAPFGPSEGWRSFSGIVRGVYLETLPETYFDDVFFHAALSDDLSEADCTLEFSTDGDPQGLGVRARLVREGRVAAESACIAASACVLHFSAEMPALWSPEQPNLYELTVELLRGKTVVDCYSCAVGFKKLEIREGHFYLNNEQVFFTGVCRHDIWTESAGFTLTDEMIEKDLRMIKSMGANFVRLVHYPHDRRVLEAADRIGLLVSEEPGLWWSDLGNTEITSRALKVLEKAIFRDRSHISVAFWLAFNECPFNEQFLMDAVALARRCDPTRLISGANCNDVNDTKEIFDKCGVDFYTLHPYGTHPTHCTGQSLEYACRVLTGKAVFFTEWGGYYVVGNPALFRDFCLEMLRLYRNRAPEPTLAGMTYWQWQDIPEYQRGEPACYDGILTEGLVTIDRVPKDNFYTFSDFIRRLHTPEPEPQAELEIYGGGSMDAVYRPLTLPQGTHEAWEQALAAGKPMPGYYWKKERRMAHGPALPRRVTQLGALAVDLPAGAPLTVSKAGGAVRIAVDAQVRALWFVGQATLGKGYPACGTRGETLGVYRLHYADGSVQTLPLRNGAELVSACALVGPTRYEPRGSALCKAFTLSYDKNWEIYQANLLRIAAQAKPLAFVEAEITDPDCHLLLYGLTAEE